MERQLFPKEPPDARKQMLIDNADQIIDNYVFERPLSEDELAVFKDAFADKSIEIQAIEDELEAIKTEYKAKLKPLLQRKGELLRTIKTRHTQEKGTVYLVAYPDIKTMGYYDESGALVNSRRMTPEEMNPTVIRAIREEGRQLGNGQ